MFIALTSADNNTVCVYENRDSLQILCWAILEYDGGTRKIVPIVSSGGKLVDANSIGKIADVRQAAILVSA